MEKKQSFAERFVYTTRNPKNVFNVPHPPLRAEINITTNVVENKIFVQNFRRGNLERLRCALSHLSLQVSASVDDAWSHFRNQMLTQQSNFILNCEKRPSNTKNPPWFNIEIKRALKARNNLHTRMKTLRTTENAR